MRTALQYLTNNQQKKLFKDEHIFRKWEKVNLVHYERVHDILSVLVYVNSMSFWATDSG